MIDTNNSKIGNPFPFRVFCQKVIPLAFDESMSYLELLYSLLHYIKETVIPAVNNNADAVTELQNLYEQLKSYVDNYFDSLDVQEEINNKLDEMVESGQFEDILNEIITKSQPNKMIFMPVANLPASSVSNIAGGDCTLIQTGTGKNILIDTGYTLSYDVIKQELIKNNVTKIDYIIISHYHPDHVGNIQNLYSDFDLTQTIFYLCKHTSNFTFPEETLLLTLAVNNEKIYPNTR